ncbi:sulfurtransferase-like selenium metabolism protein YedF [Chloroflexota bacterium]
MAIQTGFVILVESDSLGRGDKDLGQLLMQRFMHELAGTNQKPEEIIFINSAVKLVIDDSLLFGQLKRLEAEGINLCACSTCLDRFDLADKVAIGAKTSMDAIVSTLTAAVKVLTI